MKETFSELKIANYLRQAGIVKGLGFSCLTVFCLIFSMVFENKNWFRLLQSSKKENLPGKNVVYLMCDEVKELDYQTALTQLLAIMNSILSGNPVESQVISVAEKVKVWLQQLPIYIRETMLPAVANAS